MTNQEAFDIAVKGVIAQGKAAYNPYHEDCYYRSPDGSKCAIGMIIPDDQYSPDIEGTGPRALLRINSVWHIPALDDPSAGMLEALQDAHDGVAREVPMVDFVSAFISNARDVARDHDLIFPY
jgi:hypothetical protein